MPRRGHIRDKHGCVDHIFVVIFQELLQGEDERGGEEKGNDIR